MNIILEANQSSVFIKNRGTAFCIDYDKDCSRPYYLFLTAKHCTEDYDDDFFKNVEITNSNKKNTYITIDLDSNKAIIAPVDYIVNYKNNDNDKDISLLFIKYKSEYRIVKYDTSKKYKDPYSMSGFIWDKDHSDIFSTAKQELHFKTKKTTLFDPCAVFSLKTASRRAEAFSFPTQRTRLKHAPF